MERALATQGEYERLSQNVEDGFTGRIRTKDLLFRERVFCITQSGRKAAAQRARAQTDRSGREAADGTFFGLILAFNSQTANGTVNLDSCVRSPCQPFADTCE
jgi:hypothetical protein